MQARSLRGNSFKTIAGSLRVSIELSYVPVNTAHIRQLLKQINCLNNIQRKSVLKNAYRLVKKKTHVKTARVTLCSCKSKA